MGEEGESEVELVVVGNVTEGCVVVVGDDVVTVGDDVVTVGDDGVTVGDAVVRELVPS